ncbi:MAG: MATE family efflux transporter [Gammaproteobacteria bacterium]
MSSARTRILQDELRTLLAIGYPLIANNLLTYGMHVAAALMAGWLGPQSLAAVAIGGNAWTPLLLFGIGALTVITASTAQHAGAGRQDRIGAVLRQGLWLALGLGVALALLTRNLHLFLRVLDLEPQVFTLARGYLEALAWGAPGLCLYNALRYVSEGLGRTRPIMIIGGFSFCTDILLTYGLMFGKFGLPALGVVGCGWASAISMWLMAGAIGVWIARSGAYRGIAPFARWEWPDPAVLMQMLRVGAPSGVTVFLEAALFGGAALLLAWMGTAAAAAHQIALNYAGLMFMVPMGLAFATTVRVGHAIGAGDRAHARSVGFLGMGLAAAFMLVSGLAMLAFGPYIIGWYTDDAEVTRIARSLILVAAAFQLFDGLQVAANCALRGLKDTRVPMLLTLAAYWGVGFPTAWWLGVVRDGGPALVWVGLSAGLAAAAALLGARFAAITRAAPA